MAKLTAYLVTIIGIILILQEASFWGWFTALDSIADYYGLLIGILVLVIGIGKLIRNYSKKRR